MDADGGSAAEIEKTEAKFGEIVEDLAPIPTATPTPNANPKPGSTPGTPRSVRTKVPEVEVHVYRRGKGPVEVLRCGLGGWDQDRLEVGDILEKHGFKSIFAFEPEKRRRGVPIRFNARNGRSMLPYRDGAVIYVDGEPKDPMVKPITKIVIGVAVMALLIAVLMREAPEWFKWFNATVLTSKTFPPWVIACMIIAFTRLRKRTKDVLRKFGW